MKKKSLKISWWSCHGLFCREGHIGQAEQEILQHRIKQLKFGFSATKIQ